MSLFIICLQLQETLAIPLQKARNEVCKWANNLTPCTFAIVQVAAAQETLQEDKDHIHAKELILANEPNKMHARREQVKEGIDLSIFLPLYECPHTPQPS